MIVTFVSECDKKAINKTCRVLDAFANRLGNRTWQTVITNEGLQSVKKLLRATASKNTAVACHWINRSRRNYCGLLRWKIYNEGFVPVNLPKRYIKITLGKWLEVFTTDKVTDRVTLFHDCKLPITFKRN